MQSDLVTRPPKRATPSHAGDPDPDPDPALALLRAVYPPDLFGRSTSAQSTPFVTLTYAQSLDAKIAGPGRRPLPLSGPDSMRLTHRLRQLHDSILVGVGTVLNDDPQLTARIPDLLPLEHQPRPIVLDSSLRTPPACKLLTNARKRISHPVTIVHRAWTDTDIESASEEDAGVRERAAALQRAGALLVPLEPDKHGRLLLSALLAHRLAPGLLGRSLMIEGGASVIASCLAASSSSCLPGRPLIDLVIVTVAPVWVGPAGVPALGQFDHDEANEASPAVPALQHIATQTFGRDSVFVARPVRAA